VWASELVLTKWPHEKPFASARDRTPVVQSVVRRYTRGSQTVGRGEALLVLWRGRVVCTRNICLDEIGTHNTIYFGRHYAWLKYFTYQYGHWLRTIRSTFCRRLKMDVFLRRNTPTSKNEVTLFRTVYSFRIILPTKGIIALLSLIFIYRASMSFHFPSCILRSARHRFLKVDRNKRLIHV
jgi:hypothetical protein